MAYPGPPPASFLPPSPPVRKSRIGGFLLILAGLAAAGSVWLPWIKMDKSTSLKELYEAMKDIGGIEILDNPRTWFYAVLGGAAVAVLFGLIGLAGGKGPNVMAGLFGLLSAVAIAYPIAWVWTSDFPGEPGEVLDLLAVGYYLSAGAALLALLAVLLAFVGSAKK